VLRRREIVAVVGRNNAGKTTLLRSIAGLVPCRADTMSLAGRSLIGLPPEARSACGLVYVPHGPNVFPGLTVRENLLLGGWATRNRGIQRVTDILPPLAGMLASHAGALGQFGRQLCAIGRALMTQPAVMLLDEPVRGLAPAESACLLGFLPDILATDVSVLFTEHDLEGIVPVADRMYLIDRGQMICTGPPAALLSDQRFLNIYRADRDL
jgi:branched-chain amino acid transport system ATP-binding protein